MFARIDRNVMILRFGKKTVLLAPKPNFVGQWDKAFKTHKAGTVPGKLGQMGSLGLKIWNSYVSVVLILLVLQHHLLSIETQ